MTGVYTANADSLNTRKDVDTLLYSKSDGVYYYSCKDASAYKIDRKTDNDADYVFATVQTLNRDEHLLQYDKNAFDCIVLDEAHHVTADTYQKIMKHFSPKLWLGMTATPDKRDDNVAGRNVYELFNYQIAYEIGLQQAMEENLLCPFHYFGITDLSIVGDDKDNRDFSMLTSDERVKHIIQQANYYGLVEKRLKDLYSGVALKRHRNYHISLTI